MTRSAARRRALAACLAMALAAPITLAAPPAAAHAPAGVPAALPAVVPAAVPTAPPGPPQGPLAQTGCTLAGATAACDLWAKAGTVVLPGATGPVPIWGFASTDPAPATLPGPVLVVDQGQTVTITIHNGLSSNLSLALPAVTGLVPDQTGAAPGASKAYTFVASRPGTYLYEAGHTADGARQAAMGLVGALVVRDITTVDGRPTAYGDATSAYDDEAVLVLTEVDPAFNANPAGFDLRSYSPRYRLINGKAFPETDVIATDIKRHVLLRYVDAGLQEHAMTLLGLDQSVVGQDARPAAYPEGAVTIPLKPGQAVDAVVAMPASGDGRTFALMESGGWLNNNGQRYGATPPGTSPQQAFGGMLTFLDTNPPPVSGDHVGPTAANVKATPDPASVLAPVIVTADFTDALNGNSTVDSAELVLDDLSVAEGTSPMQFGSPAFGTGPTVTGATATIPTSALETLTQGRHTVFVRAHDMAGNWGVVGSTTFTLSVTGAVTTGVLLNPNPTAGTGAVTLTASGDDSGLGGTVQAAEYFIDAAGTNGSGTAMTLASPGATASAESATIPAVVVAALTEGRHSVLVHTRDSFGLWGPTASVDLVVDRTVPTLQSAAVTPAVTNGSNGSVADPTDLRVDATFTDPVVGAVNSPIAAAEGFLDIPGASGSGFTFQALDGGFDSASETTFGLLPLTELTGLADGTHTVWVHARDAAGNWGPPVTVQFTVDRTGPSVSGLTASPNPTNGAATVALTATATDALSTVAGAEWFDGTDPGAGHGTAMTVSGSALSASISTAGLAAGTHTLRVRARDSLGNWGPVASVTLTVVPNAIFADAFASRNTSAWSQTIGSPSAASGALVATGTGYVVDNTPVGEHSFHAKFDFTVGTFNARSATVDLFQARGAAGTAILTVQYRRNGTANQFRLGLLRNGAWAYTGWVNAAGATVRVDWSGATAGSATLTVGTVTIGTLTGNTSAYTVESAALGLVASTGATSGSATFDNYASTRFTAP
jgi:Multicopper oxidase